MRFDVIAVLPELIEPFLQHGVTRRAFAAGGAITVKLWALRAFAEGGYQRVDDRPYGGGPGMVLLAEPLERAIAAVRADRGAAAAAAPVIHFTPAGQRIDQALLRRFTQSQVQEPGLAAGAILLCGRYEGIDQRVIDAHVTLELSLGDFVLSGAELAACALLDGVARLLPGVLGDARSHQQDSFEDGLLDCPHYTRPESLPRGDGMSADVPPVLLSGHHGDIARWRRQQSLAHTAARRPDLIAQARANGMLDAADECWLAGDQARGGRASSSQPNTG